MFSLDWVGSTTGPGSGETPGMAGDWRTVVAGLAEEAGDVPVGLLAGTVVEVDVAEVGAVEVPVVEVAVVEEP
jgi:hypothetical protein